MKKIVIALVIMLFVSISFAQETEKFQLSGRLQSTHFDNYLSATGDTISKIGTFSKNEINARYFFGYSSFQFGLSGSFLRAVGLINPSHALRYQDRWTIGPVFRYSSDRVEIQFGAEFSAWESISYLTSADTSNLIGMKIPLRLIYFQDNYNFLPKISFCGEQDLYFLSSIKDINRGYYNLELNLDVYRWDFCPDLYFSPSIGAEMGTMIPSPIIKVGGVISSNWLNADIIRGGLFFGVTPKDQIFGLEIQASLGFLSKYLW